MIDDGRPTDHEVLLAARQIVRQHGQPPAVCGECTPNGCDALVWATTELRRARQAAQA